MTQINAKDIVAPSPTAFLGFGAMQIDVIRGDKVASHAPLCIPATVPFEQAADEAPDVYRELDSVASGAELFEIAKQRFLAIVGPDVFARNWLAEEALYEDVTRDNIEGIARRIAKYGRNHAAKSALSLIVYGLRGLTAELELEELSLGNGRRECPSCYRTVTRRRYCDEHGPSEDSRRDRTKKKGEDANHEVMRRRAPRVKEIALSLRRDESKIYGRLYRSLVGMSEGFDGAPPPLEGMKDDHFVTGARIGANGAEWLLFLWHVLPRVRKNLGPDWPPLVYEATDDGNWKEVLERLKRIDGGKKTSDAYEWVQTLIEAEAYSEAEEIEPTQRRPRGRPRKEVTDKNVQAALVELSNGVVIKQVARNAGIDLSTAYRWKRKAAGQSGEGLPAPCTDAPTP